MEEKKVAQEIYQNCYKNNFLNVTMDQCLGIVKHIFAKKKTYNIEYLDCGSVGLALKYHSSTDQINKGAVKVIQCKEDNEKQLIEVKKEIDIQFNIKSPCIAKVLDFEAVKFDQYFTFAFIWMHYYEAGSLKKYLDELRVKKQEMDFDLKLRLCVQLFDTLECVHKNNIFHRDIKAANILMSQSECAIADFGVSRIQNMNELISLSSIYKGTPLFLDPELHQGKLNKQMDLFAMGIVLLMMDNVVNFCYETHDNSKIHESRRYYQTSFFHNKITLELKEKLKTNTIFFKIAEKLITSKIKDRPTAAQCLNMLLQEIKRLGKTNFFVQIYSDQNSILSSQLQDDESVLGNEGEEEVSSITVRQSKIKSFNSSISPIASYLCDDQSLINKGTLQNAQTPQSVNSVQTGKEQQQIFNTNTNFFQNWNGKTINNKINSFGDAIFDTIQSKGTILNKQQNYGFSDKIDQLYQQSSSLNQSNQTDRSLIQDESLINQSSTENNSIISSISLAYEKFYINQKHIITFQGSLRSFKDLIESKRRDQNQYYGISFKYLAPEDQNTFQDQLAIQLGDLLNSIQSYYEALSYPILYFELDLRSLSSMDEACIQLICNFLKSNEAKKLKVLYLKLKSDQKSQGFKIILDFLDKLKDLEKLDLQLLSFSSIRDKNIKELCSSCTLMTFLNSFKLNFQDNDSFKDDTLEYLGEIFSKLQYLEEIQLIFSINSKFTDFALQNFNLSKKFQNFDFRIGNCEKISDLGYEYLAKKVELLDQLISFKLVTTQTLSIGDQSVISICQKLKIITTLKVFNLQFNFAENITNQSLINISEVLENPEKEFQEIVIIFNFSKKFTDHGIYHIIRSIQGQKKLQKLKLGFSECSFLDGDHLLALYSGIYGMEQLISFHLDFNESYVSYGLDNLFSAFSRTLQLKKLKIFLGKYHLDQECQNKLLESVENLQLQQLALKVINNNREQYQGLKNHQSIKNIRQLQI